MHSNDFFVWSCTRDPTERVLWKEPSIQPKCPKIRLALRLGAKNPVSRYNPSLKTCSTDALKFTKAAHL